MVKENQTGFREIAHTADWELQVWGVDMPSLMENAAEGMYTLSGTRFVSGSPVSRTFEVPFLDRESTLVDFLSELLFLSEQEEIGFDHFDIRLEGDICKIIAFGAPIASKNKDIKAVTFHNLLVRETENGLSVNIVFDV